jgi:hypothetical protein
MHLHENPKGKAGNFPHAGQLCKIGEDNEYNLEGVACRRMGGAKRSPSTLASALMGITGIDGCFPKACHRAHSREPLVCNDAVARMERSAIRDRFIRV